MHLDIAVEHPNESEAAPIARDGSRVPLCCMHSLRAKHNEVLAAVGALDAPPRSSTGGDTDAALARLKLALEKRAGAGTAAELGAAGKESAEQHLARQLGARSEEVSRLRERLAFVSESNEFLERQAAQLGSDNARLRAELLLRCGAETALDVEEADGNDVASADEGWRAAQAAEERTERERTMHLKAEQAHNATRNGIRRALEAATVLREDLTGIAAKWGIPAKRASKALTLVHDLCADLSDLLEESSSLELEPSVSA